MAVTPRTLLHGAATHSGVPGISSGALVRPCGLDGFPVVFRCQRLRWQRRWRENGDSSRGGHGGVNGSMAEAARGERGRCEGGKSRTRMRQRKGGTNRTSSGGLGRVAKSGFYCTTWELGGGEQPETFRVLSGPDNTNVFGVLTSLPSQVPPYSPLIRPLLSKNTMAG